MRKLLGILTIGLVIAAGVIAIVYTYKKDLVSGLILTGSYIIGWLLIAFSYCSKCYCGKQGCIHVLPGLLLKILPKREAKLYGALDILGVFSGLILISLLPGVFIAGNLFFLIIYIFIHLLTAATIFLFVCKGCGNKYCAFTR